MDHRTLAQIIIYALSTTGIYVAFQQGNVLGWLRIAAANSLDKLLGKKWSRYVQKPLWDCLPCMASVWTVVFSLCRGTLNPYTVFGVLGVCGLNAIIERLFFDEKETTVGAPPLPPSYTGDPVQIDRV